MFTITRYSITDAKISSEFHGYKIIQVSDLHNRDWKGKLLKTLEEESPDSIFVTGDLINSYQPCLAIALAFLEQARKIAPVYMVSGNHESRVEGVEQMKACADDETFYFMDNRSVLLRRGDGKIVISGIQDPDFIKEGQAHEQQAIVREEIDGIKATQGEFQILLSHRPEHFQVYVEKKMDLVFCGHAHGGQFRLPFTQGLYAPHQGIFPKYTAGMHHRDSTRMIVSRGLADSSFPIRMGNPFELVVVTLRREE